MLFYWMSFLILFLWVKSMCFADHLNSLLLIFCSFSIILSLVPIVLFCSYLILISKRMHLIHKCVVFKGWQQPKNIQHLCILLYRIKENFLHPPRLSNFHDFPTHASPLPPSRLLNYKEFSNPTSRLFQPPFY